MLWANMDKAARIEAIQERTSRGLTAGQIGEELGTTRNAVIGYWNRYTKVGPGVRRQATSKEASAGCVPLRSKSQREKRAALPKKESRLTAAPHAVSAAKPKPPIAPPLPAMPMRPEPEPVFLPPSIEELAREPRTVTLLEAGHRRCKRPTWPNMGACPPVHQQWVCGAPTAEGETYCGPCRSVLFSSRTATPIQPPFERPRRGKGDRAFPVLAAG